MVNDTTGAEFGPQEGVIDAPPQEDDQAQFYVKETVTEKVVDAVLEETADGEQQWVTHESDHVTERTFGPFVEFVADQEAERVKGRHRALALPGEQTVDKVPASDVSTEPAQQPAPAAQQDTVSDPLNPNADSGPAVGGTVEDPGASNGDLIPDKATGDAPSWSVTPADVPTSDQETDGVTNPEYTPATSDPNPDAEPALIPSAPAVDPSTTDAITTASTEPDDSTPKDDAPPVAPTAPVGADNPVVDESNSPAPVDPDINTAPTVQDVEVASPAAPTTIDPASFSGDTVPTDATAEQVAPGDVQEPAASEPEATQEASGTIISTEPATDAAAGPQGNG